MSRKRVRQSYKMMEKTLKKMCESHTLLNAKVGEMGRRIDVNSEMLRSRRSPSSSKTVESLNNVLRHKLFVLMQRALRTPTSKDIRGHQRL